MVDLPTTEIIELLFRQFKLGQLDKSKQSDQTRPPAIKAVYET